MTKALETKCMPCGDAAVAAAARLLKAGKLVALPTETVYGLAADASNPEAVRRIFEVKGRPQDNPLIVHIAALDMWEPLVRFLPERALRLAKAFWPGPLTVILPKSDNVPDVTTAGLDSVAVRMPDHACARAVIAACGLPLAAPSANLSGSPSPTSARHCLDDLSGKVPLILDGGPCAVGIESTVVSLVGAPVLLRPGAVTAGQLSEALGEQVALSEALTRPLAQGERPTSPGMKYRHYAPKAKVILVEGPLADYLKLLRRAPADAFGLVFFGEEQLAERPCVVYGAAHDPKSQARGLFAALRRLDELGARVVYARSPDPGDETMGIYNRMLRAAAFEVIVL